MHPHLWSLCLAAALGGCASAPSAPPPKIGVVYVFHGGSSEHGPRASWEATLQIFSYDPHSPVYRHVIWNPERWPQILAAGNAPKEQVKYAFSYGRIGGRDPAQRHMLATFGHFARELEAREDELAVDFLVDYASWLSPDPRHHVYPRAIFRPGVPGGTPMTYCGSAADGGAPPDDRWPGCDPHRYDVDGTIERLLQAGVGEIVMVDLTTSGVRFFKTWDVVNLARQVVAQFNARNGTSVAVRWVNDPTDLMTESYPVAPERWTLSQGEPLEDRRVPLAGRPNPVSEDPRLALLQVRGIESQFPQEVDPARLGVLLVNHATREGNRWFDPKIDDTLVLDANIERLLLERHPGMQPENVVGAWFGRMEVNPEIAPSAPGRKVRERTRRMRGENLGDAWLYESDQLPAGEAGFLYWEALEHLGRRGVEHIVVAFPQIMVDSVLNLVEVPNQIAKEIGWRTWRHIEKLDFATYPGEGHPFADYWGIWVESECPAPDGSGARTPCCFTMGGCADGRPYPPPRLAPRDRPRDDLDPSLAFDVSEYGHLGYDPARGPPDPSAPVQRQYRGTWSMWQPPNGDSEVGRFLADKVIELLRRPRAVPPAPIPLHQLERRG